MTAPVRHPATDILLFTLGGTAMITAFENGTVVFNVKDEDASGAKDLYTYPWAQKGDSHIEVDLFVEATAALMPLTGTSITFSLSTGAGIYSGQCLVTMGNHQIKHSSLQRQKAMLKIQGAPTLS